MQGLVIRGSRNVFTLRVGADLIEGCLKGKVLKAVEGCYNPLAPGDWVDFERPDPERGGPGIITGLRERRNVFSRFNQKGQAPQAIAANVDLAVCLSTPASPPFRPRFLDRLLLQAEAGGIPALLGVNKIDLGLEDRDIRERLDDFRRIGYEVLCFSVKTGEGLDVLKERIAGKVSVLLGQSGVGKSSLLNTLIPDLRARVGDINEKYDRGSHTTTQGIYAEAPFFGTDGTATALIDTPGERRFSLWGIVPEDLIFYLREFAPLAGTCAFGLSCSHETEGGCKIREGVASGDIHPDRYESFLRIREELQTLSKKKQIKQKGK